MKTTTHLYDEMYPGEKEIHPPKENSTKVYSKNVFDAFVFAQAVSRTTTWICMLSLLLPFTLFAQQLQFAGGIGGTSNDSGEDIAVDAMGNTYITGLFFGTADFDIDPSSTFNLTSAGQDDIYVAKYDPTGALVWARRIGGSGSDFGHGITVDLSGNVVVTGDFHETVDFDPGAGVTNLSSQGLKDIFVLKLDANGDFLWAFGIGGIEDDAGHDVDVDPSGNVYITGGYDETVDFDPGPGVVEYTSAGDLDIYLAKYDPDGNLIWAQSSQGGDDSNQRGWAITVDDAGNSHVAGWFKHNPDVDMGPGEFILPNNGKSDAWLGKYDTNGAFLWAFSLGAGSRDHGMDVGVDADGNCYITGLFRNSIDFDPGPGDFTITATGPQEAFLAKYDANGNFVWAFNAGHTSVENSQSLAASTDSQGNTAITGLFDGNVDLDPGPGVSQITSYGGNDIFVARYTADMELEWGIGLGGTGSDFGQGIAVDESGNTYATGKFQNTANFNPDAGNPVEIASDGLTDVYIARYGPDNSSPVAEFSFIENDLMLDFDASGSTDDDTIVSWDWDFGDGNTDSGEFVSHTFGAIGTYTVTLTVTDNLGATGSTSQTIDVGNPAPLASFTALQVAGTFDVDFDAAGSTDDGSIVAWDWDFGDGNTGFGETSMHTYAAVGTYSVILTVTDDEGATGEFTMDVEVVNEAPVASFVATQVAGTLDVDFDASSSSDDGTIVSWDWDFGDGNTDAGETLSHTYAAAGTYTVMLTVTDNLGATGTLSIDVDVVNESPVAAFTTTQTGGTLGVDFDASGSTDDGSIASWDWDFGDGNTDTGETLSHTYAAAGTYTVVLTVTDNLGATGSISVDIDVVENQDPVASFIAAQVAGTLDVDFDGSGSTDDGTIVSWDWDFGDGNTDSGEMIAHSYAAPGTYTVALTVTDDVGASHVASADVEVTDPNMPPVAVLAATQVAGTLDVDFDGSGSTDDDTIVSWDWDFGDGNTGSGETITHTYAAPGTFTAMLTVTDNAGATHAVTADVEVVDPNGPPVAAFTATQVAGTLDVDFDGSGSSDDGTITSWNWDFGDGNTGSGETIAHTYAADGTYTVMLTVTDDLGATGTTTADVEVVANEVPVASFIATQVAGTLDVDFDASGSTDDGSITSWDWDFGDGNTDTGETIAHTFAAVGTYTVVLTVTDNGGLTGSATQDVVVTEGTDDGPFVESGGMVVMEAENFHTNIARGDHVWIENADNAGFTGATAMLADPDNGTIISSGNEDSSAELVYDIDVSTTGDYHIWARVWADDAGDNSVHLGVDGSIDPQSRGARWSTLDNWVWQELTRATNSITYDISTTGVHTLNLWMLEDGAYVDKLLMTTDPNFVPTGDGPDESPRGAGAAVAGRGRGMDLLQLGDSNEAASVVEIPEEFGLAANYPNPFNPTTTIAFDLPEASDVRLEVYDMMGRRIATLVNGQMAAGRYEASWHATSDTGALLASGVYLYRMQAGAFVSVQRMVLMK